MPTRRVVIPLLAAALIVQGAVAMAPHQHGPANLVGSSVEHAGSSTGPHHCLACSIQSPAAAPTAGVVVTGSSATAALPMCGGPPLDAAAPVESTGPRGPPRVF